MSKINELLNWKIRTNYVNFDDQPYKPNFFYDLIEIANRCIFMYSISSFAWYLLLILLYTKQYFYVIFYVFVLSLLLVSGSVYVILKKDFKAYFIGSVFILLGYTTWFIRIY